MKPEDISRQYSKETDRINCGDSVDVRLLGVNSSNTDTIKGEVVFVPSGPGDYWIIKALNGHLYYMQTFAFIRKYVPKD